MLGGTKISQPLNGQPKALPIGWRWGTLGTIAERIDYGFTASADFSIRAPKFLRITDIQNGKVDWDSVPGCKTSETEARENSLREGDIVFARTGATTGKSFLIQNPPNSVFASYLIRVRAKTVIDPEFLSLFFRTDYYWQQIREGARGGIQPGFNATMLRALMIPLPPLPEQRRIAARLREQLAEVEKARAAVQAQFEAAETLLAAQLRSAFESVAASDWPGVPLGETSEVAGGIQKTPERAPRHFHKQFLTVRNVQRGFLDLTNIERFEVTPAEFQRCRLQSGDILIVEGNGSPDHIGRNALFNQEGEWIHQNHIIRVRVSNEQFHPEFVSLFLNSPPGRKQMLEKAKTTTGLYTLSTSKVASLIVPSPSLAEQARVIEEATAQASEARSLQLSLTQRLAALDLLPAALLRDAFAERL